MKKLILVILVLLFIMVQPIQAITLEWGIVDFHVYYMDRVGHWSPLPGSYVGVVDVLTYQRFEGYTNGYGYWSTKVPAKRGYTWFVYPPLQYFSTCHSVPNEPNCGYIYLNPQEYAGYNSHWIGVCSRNGL